MYLHILHTYTYVYICIYIYVYIHVDGGAVPQEAFSKLVYILWHLTPSFAVFCDFMSQVFTTIFLWSYNTSLLNNGGNWHNPHL